MANSTHETPKDPWQPKNCKCGLCIKVSSSIQMRCCEIKGCVSTIRQHMQPIFEKANEEVSLEIKRQPQLNWHFKCMLDRERLLATLKRSAAYRAYTPYKKTDKSSAKQTDGSSQQKAADPTSAFGSNIPRCVVRRIREEFPDPKGKYTGFNTSNTLAMLFENFVQDTDKDENAFAVMNPEAVAALTEHNAQLKGAKKDIFEKAKDSFTLTMSRMPRMGIITTVVSFEWFIKDAVTLAVDAVCYDFCHVNEKDYYSSLRRALSEGELSEETKKNLRSLSDCSDDDEWNKFEKWAKNDASTKPGKEPAIEPKNLPNWQWPSIRATLKIKLRDSASMQTVFYSNFFQTLLEETKKKHVRMDRPVLCDFMQCLRSLLFSAFGKDPTRVEHSAGFHYLCDKANLAEDKWDRESKQVQGLLTHLIRKSGRFQFFYIEPQLDQESRNKESKGSLEPKVELSAAAEQSVKVRPANINALCNMSCLFYGIRCLYCHGSGEKTIETGVLSERSFSCIELEAESEADRDRAKRAQDYLIRLRNRARRDSIKLEADRFLYLNTANFYKYFAKLLAKASVCLVHYCNEQKIAFGEKYAKETFFDKLEMSMPEINDATAAMKSDKN